MLTAVAAIGAFAALAAVFGLLLGYSAVRFHVDGDPIADQVDALLPQSQCGQCGFPGCRPYAEAVAAGEADISACTPGGGAAMLAMADLLGVEPSELGEIGYKAKSVAVIDEETCIGCTKCLQACPVDAIVGAAKQLHGIIASECTGCDLCKAPCPVDCIQMEIIPESIGTWRWPYPDQQPIYQPQTQPSPAPGEIEHREAA
ncbi:MAG: electron transport complex subunit RsxB [Thiohalocapsa sp.]